MDSQVLYPLEHCKTLHLIRHGQALHNVAAAKDRKAYLSPDLFDAPLTPHGQYQVRKLRDQVIATGLLNRAELVITSPLLRTMQTAEGLFGNEKNNCPPIVALELVRDRTGLRPPDKRRTVSECQSLFPAIDFSLIKSEDDMLWNSSVRESLDEASSRGREFIKWLWTRKEKEIVVVSHLIVLRYILDAFPRNPFAPLLYQGFDNCEHRAVVIVEKRATHQDSSTIYGYNASEKNLA